LGTSGVDTVSDRVLANAFRDGNLMDQRRQWCCTRDCGFDVAAWLPTFIHLNRNPRLVKTDVPPGMFAAQIVRPAIGCCSMPWAGVLGWFVHPEVAVAIFVFMVCYYAATSRGVRTAAFDRPEPI